MPTVHHRIQHFSRAIRCAGLGLCFGLLTAAPIAQAQNQPTTGQPANPPSASCLSASPFNLSSAESTTQKILAAGYTNVRGLYQGCDALWRGHALQNGRDVSIMVTMSGRVVKTGY